MSTPPAPVLERTNSTTKADVKPEMIPIENFNLLVKEVKDRIKINEVLCALIEDYIEVETTLGKQLIKVGNSACSTTKTEALAILSGGWDGFYRFSVALGKEHTIYGTNLIKSITVILPEQVRQLQRTLHSTHTKIQTSTEELKKLIRSFNKSKESYAKIVQEAEQAIKARDTALRESEVSAETQNQDEGFIRKMLKPNVAKLQDKCCDFIREIDSAETHLTLTTRMLNTMRESLIEDYRKSIMDVVEVDRSRLNCMGESLTKLIISTELIHDRLDKSIQAVRTQSVNLDISDSFRSVTDAVPQPQDIVKWADLGQILPAETLLFLGLECPAFPSHVFFKSERAVSFCDSFKAISGRSMQTLAELVDCERSFRKTASKILEKHGYGKAAAGSFVDCLDNFESPSSRTAWQLAMKMLHDSCNTHISVATCYENAYNTTLNKLYRTLEMCKQEVAEGAVAATKKVDAVRSNMSKLATRLSKIQRELRDRKKTIAERNSSSTQSTDAVIAAVYDESGSHYFSDEESYPPNEETKGTEQKPASPVPSNKQRRSSMMDMMGGLESLKSATKAVKEAVRTTSLGAVVGQHKIYI